jgi:hypothetical protein
MAHLHSPWKAVRRAHEIVHRADQDISDIMTLPC